MAGLTEARAPGDADSFWTWRQWMFRFLQHLSPDHIEAITAYTQMEMLQAGYGRSIEFHYLHHQPDGTPYPTSSETSERVLAAADQSGIGLTLLPVFYEFGGCDKRPLSEGQIRFGCTKDQFEALYGNIAARLPMFSSDTAFGVAAHSLRAVTPADMQWLQNLGGDQPIHLHLAEQMAEVEEIRSVYGQSPAALLMDHADVDDRWSLIHCTHIYADEIHRLAETGAVVGLCPITEANLGDGIFPAKSWLEAGGRISIGSDSNVRISLSEELRLLEYSQRLQHRSRAILSTAAQSTGRRLFEAAVSGGARAAGNRLTGITEGAWADLLALDDQAIALTDRSSDQILDSFIFAGGDQLIKEVWSAGRHCVTNGQHIRKSEIEEKYRRCLKDLRNFL